MNKLLLLEIQRAVEAAINRWMTARLTTNALPAAGAAAATAKLDVVARCQNAHRIAAESAHALADVLATSPLPLLSAAAADVRTKAKAAKDEADKLTLASAVGTALLAADEAMIALLGDIAAAVSGFGPLEQKCAGWRDLIAHSFEHNAFGGVVIGVLFFMVLWWFGNALGGGEPLLEKIAPIENARGLLTLLVGVGTIFVGLIIVIGMWVGDGDEQSEKKFSRSKEVFALLLSVFGTVLGFYYGSDKGAGALESKLAVSPVVISRMASNPLNVTFAAAVSGGKPPYYFAVESGTPALVLSNKMAVQGGTITHTYSNAPLEAASFLLVVTDASTNQVKIKGEIPKNESAPKPPAGAPNENK